MRTLSVSLRTLLWTILLGAVCGTPTLRAGAQTVSTLYTFTGGANGEYPESQLVADKNGNFYGTVYEITP